MRLEGSFSILEPGAPRFCDVCNHGIHLKDIEAVYLEAFVSLT